MRLPLTPIQLIFWAWGGRRRDLWRVEIGCAKGIFFQEKMTPCAWRIFLHARKTYLLHVVVSMRKLSIFIIQCRFVRFLKNGVTVFPNFQRDSFFFTRSLFVLRCHSISSRSLSLLWRQWTLDSLPLSPLSHFIIGLDVSESKRL